MNGTITFLLYWINSIALLLFFSSALTAGPLRAIVPFYGSKNVDKEYFQAFEDSFYLEASRDGVDRIIPPYRLKELIENYPTIDFSDDSEVLRAGSSIGSKGGASEIIIALVGHNNASPPVYFINAYLIDTQKDIIKNKVFWTRESPLAQRKADLVLISKISRIAARKLLWQAPNVYPVQLHSSSWNSADRSNLRTAIHQKLKALNLPTGVELDGVQIKAAVKERVLATGIIGCVTLVGWTFLPYHKVEGNLDLQIHVKALEAHGMQRHSFQTSVPVSENFMLYTSKTKRKKKLADITLQELDKLILKIKDRKDFFKARNL